MRMAPDDDAAFGDATAGDGEERQGGVNYDDDDEEEVDFSVVGPPPAAPVKEEEEEEEEEDDGEPDPAKDLAEVVMQAVFEWNTEHEVVNAEIPWIDVEAVVDETYKEALALAEFLREQDEREEAEAVEVEVVREEPEVVDAEVVRDGTQQVSGGDSFTAEGDGGEVLEAETPETPYRPPPETTNIFEPSFDDEEDGEVDLEEPDARTVALARREEFLYGFEASSLPKDVLDAVEAAGEETRRMAYVRLLAGISSQPYEDNLRLARQLRWAARVLVPREEDNPLGVSDEVLTQANVAAVKELVKVAEKYPRGSRTSTGGWCLWVMKSLRNRDEDSDGHLALDDETAGMMFDLRSQLEKDKSRMKVASRMFRKGLEEEVFKRDTGGLLTNTTSEAFNEYAMDMGQRILYLAGEMGPAHGRAYDVLRELTREVFDEMASLAYDKVLITMGKEVSKHEQKLAELCPMSAAEVLKAIAQVAFYVSEAMVYLKTGEAGLTTDILQDAMGDLLLLNPAFLENQRFYEVYARDSVISELTDPSPAGTLKMGGRLLRRVMGMYKDDAVAANTRVLADELSQRLFDADDSLPDVRRSWDNLMWNLELDDNDYDSEETMTVALKAVLSSLVEKLIKAGMEQPSPKTAEMCATLGMGQEDMTTAFSLVSGDIFEKALLGLLRDKGTAADGTPTVLFRSDPLTDEELKELTETAVKVGVAPSTALDVVSKELKFSLTNLVTRAGKSMRNNVAKDGARIIGDANELLDGLCTQLVEAFGGTDVTATLSIAGQLASLDEYWASELCFKMVDAVRDPAGAQAEAGIPGALTSAPEPQWEGNAQRILELLGLRGQR